MAKYIPNRYFLYSIIAIVNIFQIIFLNAKINSSKIEQFLLNYKNLSGAIIISQNNECIFKKCYGYANYEFEVENKFDTKFPIASNTKSFTAVAIMQLQERKLLNVKDPITRYIQDFPSTTLTIHHLLTHSAGVPNYYRYWDEVTSCKNLEELVVKVKTWPLDFEPGNSFAYSNTNYLLLAHIIEKITGKSYAEYVTQNIFIPLGMNNSGCLESGQMIKNKAQGYFIKDTIIYTSSSFNNPITLVGNGNIYSTIEDLTVFNQALLSGRLLTKESISLLFSSHIKTSLDDSSCRAHGYGWFIDTVHNKRIVEYSGALVGFLSRNIIFIDEGLAITILTNVEDFDTYNDISSNISSLLLSEK